MVAVLGIWRAGPGFSRKWPQFSSSTLISLIWGCWGEQRVSELHLTRRKQKKCFPCWKLGFKKYSQKWKQQTKIVPIFFKHMPMHSMHIHFKNWKKKRYFCYMLELTVIRYNVADRGISNVKFCKIWQWERVRVQILNRHLNSKAFKGTYVAVCRCRQR